MGIHPLTLNRGIGWMLLVSLALLWFISRTGNGVVLPGIEPPFVQSAACNPDTWYSDHTTAVPLSLCRVQYTCNVNSLCFTFNPLTPNDHYSGRTAPLTYKCCILYIYSTNKGTEFLKHGIYCPFFSLQNAVCFIILMYLVPVLFTFYIQCVLRLKK